jgi:hypothetical protein
VVNVLSEINGALRSFEVFLLTPFWWVKLGWGFWRCFTQAVH